jgi:hypothetical protein
LRRDDGSCSVSIVLCSRSLFLLSLRFIFRTAEHPSFAEASETGRRLALPSVSVMSALNTTYSDVLTSERQQVGSAEGAFQDSLHVLSWGGQFLTLAAQ